MAVQVVTLNEAKALLKVDDDLIIAVYDYWLNKRLRLVRCLSFTSSYTVQYDIVYLTCSKKLTCSQLSPPHGTNRKIQKKMN